MDSIRILPTNYWLLIVINQRANVFLMLLATLFAPAFVFEFFGRKNGRSFARS